MTKVESFDGHEHPAFHIGGLKHERVVSDDRFQVGLEELEHQIEI